MHRGRTARRRDEPEYIPRSGVADRDLPAVGGVERDTEEPADDERRARVGRAGSVRDDAGGDLFGRRAFK
jgi:hypothetical protein